MRFSVIRFTALVLGAVSLSLSACSEQGSSEQASQTAAPSQASADVAPSTPAPAGVAAADPHAGLNLARPDPHAGIEMGSAARAVRPTNRGRVLTAQHAGPYSYLEVEQGGRRVWLAATRANVAPGQEIAWGDAAVMRNFTSKSLERTFPELLFVSSVVPAEQLAAAASATATAQGRVLSVSQAAGYSYIEVESQKGPATWLAAPMTDVKPGDKVSWSGGSVMRNFSSNSLNRTFDEILFVAAVSVQR